MKRLVRRPLSSDLIAGLLLTLCPVSSLKFPYNALNYRITALSRASEMDVSSKVLHKAIQTLCSVAHPYQPQSQQDLDICIAMTFLIGYCPIVLTHPLKPIIILIGGTSGSGKSTLAEELRRGLGVKSEIVSTDSLRDNLRPSFPLSHLIWKSTYNVIGKVFDGSEEMLKEVQKGFELQVAVLKSKLFETVRDHFHGPLLVEGVHITPEIVKELSCDYPQQIVPLFLRISDPEEHRNRFKKRGPKSNTWHSSPHPSDASSPTDDSSTSKYLRYFDNISCISDYLSQGAQDAGILVVDNVSELQVTTNRVYLEILSTLRQQQLSQTSP